MQDNFEQDEESPVHDRGIPSVNERSPTQKRKLVLILLISLIIIAFVIGAFIVKTTKSKEKNAPKPTQQTERKTSHKTFDFTPEVPPIDVAGKMEDVAKKVPPVEPIEDPQQKLSQELGQDEDEEEKEPAVPPPDPRLTSPIVNDGDSEKESNPSAAMSGLPDPQQVVANASNTLSEGGEEEADGPLSQQLTPTVTAAKNASLLPKRDYLLTKGAIFPCNMDTSLDSTVAGMVRCKISKNVYSANGRVLLIEKGSEAVGEYQSNAKQGQSRIYVLWNNIHTPNGIDIPLDSLSTDRLGGMGIPGHVDSHFWERFGGAMMISITGDALQLLKQSGNGEGTNVYTNSADQAGKMSEEALRNTINIPPTIYTNHGEKVQIYVARNINFESVYHVR